MTYKEAAKVLEKVGCNRATGEALCAMYARTISFHCCLDGPNGKGEASNNLFLHLRGFQNDKAIIGESRRLLRCATTPGPGALDAANIAFPETEEDRAAWKEGCAHSVINRPDLAALEAKAD